MKKIYEKFVRYGITPPEISAAIECVAREKGRKPTFNEITLHIAEYIQWRTMERGRKEGDLTVTVKLTQQGKRNLEVGHKVDKLFTPERG